MRNIVERLIYERGRKEIFLPMHRYVQLQKEMIDAGLIQDKSFPSFKYYGTNSYIYAHYF